MAKEKVKSLHSGHRSRLRQKAIVSGVHNLPEHEVLELLLSFIIPRKDVNPLAHLLIKQFGSLKKVFDSEVNDLCKISGISKTTAEKLALLWPIFIYSKQNENRGNFVFKNTEQVLSFVNNLLIDYTTEKFFVLCLNSQNKLINTHLVSQGTANTVNVKVDDVVKYAFSHKAAAVIVAHNHPTGKPIPSVPDNVFTKKLYYALNLCGIKLFDHVIITPEGNFSYFSDGRLSEIEEQLKTDMTG